MPGQTAKRTTKTTIRGRAEKSPLDVLTISGGSTSIKLAMFAADIERARSPQEPIS
jgi:hypothetical protein